MGNYSRYARSQPAREVEIGIPEAPHRCSVGGCPNDAQVLFVVAEHDGRERSGAFADFCFEHVAPNGKRSATMKTGWTFVRWVARCGECYHRDLYARGKGKWSSLSRDGRPTVDEVREWQSAHAPNEGAR